MADFDEWNTDGDDGRESGSDLASGQNQGAPAINGGLLDPRTFPARWDPLAADAPVVEPQAPTITGPLDSDVHAEVLNDIQKAQSALPPASSAGGGLRHIDAYPAMNYLPRSRLAPPTVRNLSDFLGGVPVPKDAFGPHVTFVNDDPRNPSPDLPVTDATATMVEHAVVDSGLNAVNINSTTGGKHATHSRHYSQQGVDIDRINGRPVSPSSPDATILQNAFARQPNIYENYGPAYQTKTSMPGKSRPVPSVSEEHKRHDHFSGRK
jgi:hypothetical protein